MFDSAALAAEVRSCEAVLAALCGEFDPAAIPLAEADVVYEALARIERLAAGARLRLAARAEAAMGWRRAGYRSAAEWLARRAGTSVGVAQGELTASQHLDRLPGTTDALRQGELSSAQATAICDAAAVDPAAEERLVGAARRASLRELRDECARVRAAADPDAEARYARVSEQRCLRTFTDHEGAWNLQARGPADAGARVLAALGPIIDALFTRARVAGRREANAAYAFDALVELAGGHAPGPNPRSAAPKYLGVVRVDVEALVRGAVAGEETCEITGIGPVPVGVARRLLGEALLNVVITRGRDVATVVHVGRGPNAAQKIALLWSQPTCSRAGCDQPWLFAEVDHRVPWADTHQTVLGELDRLCRHDHRLKTNDGWALVAGRGKRDFVPPGHPHHPGPAPRSGPDPPPASP
jgi:hypothetical protein